MPPKKKPRRARLENLTLQKLFLGFVLATTFLAVLAVFGRAFAAFVAALLTFLFGFYAAIRFRAACARSFSLRKRRSKKTSENKNR